MSETGKHRALITEYTTGNGVDLGSSGDPVVPWAIQVDLPTEEFLTYNRDRSIDSIHWRGSALDLPFKDRTLDFVHASHLLEDFADWGPVLKEWDRVLKPGGYMIIAVPDHVRFRAAVARGQGDNLNHKHESYLGELPQFFQNHYAYRTLSSLFATDDPKEYSIIYVGQKTT